MMPKNFKKYNLIAGWLAFAIALITYGLTVEPTVSFWDSGEYIATSAKLQVGHPPGAPFFQMIGAFFAFFAPSADKIALFVNLVSVVSSAFTILFLYFIITNLTKKIALKNQKEEEFSTPKQFAVIGSGFVGALAYTFSDSFWYNAVETEVYAMAMLFMSAMLWLGIKWTDNLHKERGDKWLIIIALVIGLSFGVHFMALLTIPAIGMLYFFNSNYKKNLKNFIIANVISVAVLLLIFKLVLPYTLAYFGHLEIFFVNSVGLPFNSGTIIAGLSIALVFFFSLRYTYQKNKVKLHTVILCILFVLIGFSTWLMIPIRSNAHVVINENSPTDARLLLAYYNLEQYSETHLFYGPMFSEKYAGLDPDNPYSDAKPKYERDYKQNKYIIINQYKNAKQNSDASHSGLLPRLWSTSHADNYMMLTGLLDFNLKAEYFSEKELYQAVNQFKQEVKKGNVSASEYDRFLSQFSEYLDIEKPSFWANVSYMLDYQMGYMYFRYLMWNFVGRQDDVQGKMLHTHGNWLSGIDFIDELRLGSQKNLPSDTLENKGRNTYFFIPFLLGILGLVFLLFRSERQSWVIFVLFMFTGLALKVYLNEKPFEPRERDYALVGSFFAFSIWIGIGVYALFDLSKKYVTNRLSAPLVVITSLLAVPTLMAYQNWDDHDRSGKYSARAIAHAYLDSIDKDKGAMIFTIGDNDTFLLWYAQEIEGYRTDVRIINTSLLQTEWYIDQMKRKAYESEPVPSQMLHNQYAGVRDVVYHIKMTDNTWHIKDFMNWVTSNDPNTYRTLEDGRILHFYPTNKIRVPVNKENVLKSGIVRQEDADKIVDYIDITLPSAIDKARLMMLDILANNNWERPIYFSGGSYDPQEYIWLREYLQLDGLVYKLVPIKTPIDKQNPYDVGRIDTDLMYDIVMNWKWGNMGSHTIYHDPETRKSSFSFRGNMARLIEKLLEENKIEKVKNVINVAMENMPMERYGLYFTLNPYISAYYKIGEPKKARDLATKVAKKYQEELIYFGSLSANEVMLNYEEIQAVVSYYLGLLNVIEDNDKKLYEEQFERLKELTSPFMSESEIEENADYEEFTPEISEKDTLE